MKRLALLVCIGLYLLVGCHAEEDVVTMAEYQQIQNGMSYVQVQTIIGQAGEEVSSAGAADPSGNAIAETKTYRWHNASGSSMNAVFFNGKLMGKAQYGLQ